MDLYGQYLVARGIAAPLLARAHRPFDHRVHDLQMRGIEREGDVHVARLGLKIGGETLVVLDVARTTQVRQIVLTLELAEQVLGRLAEQVDEHVKTAAVRHADDGLLDPRLPALLHQIIEQGNQAVAALEREALLTDVLGVQVALQAFRSGQLPKDVLLLFDAEAALQARHLEAVLQPQALIGVRYVRELRAYRIGVYKLQVRKNILELGAFGECGVAAAGEELDVKIGIGETEILQIEHVGLGALLQPERVQLGDQVTAIRINLNETRYRALFRTGTARIAALGFPARRRTWARRQALADGTVRDLAAARLHASKIGGPCRIHPVRIDQELLVKVLDEAGICAGQCRGG